MQVANDNNYVDVSCDLLNRIVIDGHIFTFSVSAWLEKFYAHPMYNPATKSYDNLGDNCYDGTWLAALALNCSINKMKEIGMESDVDILPLT